MRTEKDFFGNIMEFDCMGCYIGSHKLIPYGGYLYEDDLVTITMDPQIPIVGFTILGVKKHVKSINDFTEDERKNIIDVLNLTIENMKKANICEEVLIIQEERSSHFHVWIVPIHKWMEKFDKSVTRINEIIDYSYTIFDDNMKKEYDDAIEKLKKEFNNN